MTPNCPKCNSNRVQRQVNSTSRIVNGDVLTGHYGCWVCLDCWYKWDGVTSIDDRLLPAGVVARSDDEQSLH